VGLSAGGLRIDDALTNVSVMFRNAAFVGDQVCPILPVAKMSGKYWTYGPDNLRSVDDTRRPGGKSNEIDWNASYNPYYCDGHAISQYIPDEDRENADSVFDLDTDTTIQLTDKIFLNREVNLVSSLLGAMTPVDLSANAGANQFDNTANDPVAYLDLQKEPIAQQIGKPPNVMLFSKPAWRAFRNNPKVLGRLFPNASIPEGNAITVAQAKALLELDDVIIAEAIQITSAEGITPVVSQYVWGAKTNSAGTALTNGALALLFYRPPAPGLRTVALGYHFTWTTGRLGSLVYKDRSPKRHADWIEVMRYYDPRIVCASAGTLFKKCTAN
jgi:hypothetical protein